MKRKETKTFVSRQAEFQQPEDIFDGADIDKLEGCCKRQKFDCKTAEDCPSRLMKK